MKNELIINQVKENRKKFRVDHFDIVLSEYYHRYKANNIILDPPYQRTFRWDIIQQSALIESILIGIPLPPIFAFSNNNYEWEIIDGLQRTTTFMNFLSGKLTLEGCSILKELNGENLSTLPQVISNAVNNARIRIELVEDNADSYSQYLLFSRLNSNGEQLSPQELRNFLVYKLSKDYYEDLQELRCINSFRELLQLSPARIKKQEDVEYILRFSIIRRHLKLNNTYNSYSNIDQLITTEIQFVLEDDDFIVSNETEIFQKTSEYLFNILGKKGYKTFHRNLNSVVNTSVIGPVISLFLEEGLLTHIPNDTVRDYIKGLYESTEYKAITSRSYSPTKRFFELSNVSYNFLKGKIDR